MKNGSSTVDKDYSNSKLPPGLLDIANLFVVDLIQYFLQIFPDNACRREILHLEVYCEYMVNGCSWIGALRDLDVSTCT